MQYTEQLVSAIKTAADLFISIRDYRSFSLSRNKRINWKPSSGKSQENEYYKRLVYKQFVQVSGLSGTQFLSYLRKRFTHLCWALYGDAILVYRFGAPILLILYTYSLFDLPQNTNNDKTRQAQKETTRLIDIGLPQSKNKVNSNSKARIESKIQWR